MPGSVVEGKDLVKQFCIDHDVQTILDIAPGEGTYYHALQGVNIRQLDGIEAWGPYLNQYDLWSKYNNLYIADVYYFNWDKLGYYDMVILGDVVEHMEASQGREVLDNAGKHGRYVVVSLPIYGYGQGVGGDGNWFERHLEQYSNSSITEMLEDLGFKILQSMQGEVVGVYICETL